MKIFVLLLVSLVTLVSADPPCHWRGHAPLCWLASEWKCEPGTFQVARMRQKEAAEGILTKFGHPCGLGGYKTLCCENGFTGQP